MRKLFGTDGIRGIANVYPITAETALQLGRATASVFRTGKEKHKILIGRDTRISGPMIECSLASGICSSGVDVLTAGILPTPAVARLVSRLGCDAGIVISASHNPFQDNGMKFFSGNSMKLSDQTEETIEALLCSDLNSDLPVGGELGTVIKLEDSEKIYMDLLRRTLPETLSLRGLKIVIDCANGAGYRVGPELLRSLGAEVIAIADCPDGTNINLGCGAMHPEVVAKAVVEHGAQLGIALDGDADRVILADESGKTINGDYIMAICALQMKADGRLKENTVVATVMSNIGFIAAMRDADINVVQTQVGDRYIVEEMLEKGYKLGGEQSGHLIFFDFATTGDGILSALQVLSVMIRSGRRLSDLCSVMKTFPQCIVNVEVKEKKELERIPEIKFAISEAESSLGERGRVLVRYSGTQHLCRIMVEGPSDDVISRIAGSLAELIKNKLG